MADLYVNDYRPWPSWVVRGNEEIARKFNTQIGTYRGHADKDPGHDMSGDLAADFWLYTNSKAQHDKILNWFKTNAVRIGATYIITWRRIWSVARASEGVRVYGGSDPHTGHVHISYGTRPPDGEEEDMPTAKEIATAVWDQEIDGFKAGQETRAEGAIRLLGSRTDTVEASLARIEAKLNTLIASHNEVPE